MARNRNNKNFLSDGDIFNSTISVFSCGHKNDKTVDTKVLPPLSLVEESDQLNKFMSGLVSHFKCTLKIEILCGKITVRHYQLFTFVEKWSQKLLEDDKCSQLGAFRCRLNRFPPFQLKTFVQFDYSKCYKNYSMEFGCSTVSLIFNQKFDRTFFSVHWKVTSVIREEYSRGICCVIVESFFFIEKQILEKTIITKFHSGSESLQNKKIWDNGRNWVS